MKIVTTDIPDILLVTPTQHGDERGYFSETYNAEALKKVGFDETFIQDNQSYNKSAGVLRGLHYQTPPFAQDKLIRVTQGSIFDVAVDIRKDSPSFGKWIGVTLSKKNGQQLLIPKGFAHGYLTLEPDTEVCYKVSDTYAPEFEMGIIWDDPQLKINWPLSTSPLVLSQKDLLLPKLKDSPLVFW